MCRRLPSSAANCRNIQGRMRRRLRVAAPQSYPVAPAQSHAGVSGGGRGFGSYAPPQHPQLETTGSVGPKSVAATRNAPAHAGTSIIVGTSDTLEILAKRYNVSQAAILQANGYKGPRALSPGQQLIIPRPTTTAAAPAPAVAAPASKPVAAASTVHIVNRGDTLTASRAATMCRSQISQKPTISSSRPSSASA